MTDKVPSRERGVVVGRDALGTVITTGDNNDVSVTIVVADTSLLAQFRPLPESTSPAFNPYRGLDAFRETDSRWFFGREKLIFRAWRAFQSLQRGNQPRILPVIGPSGSGKSSLVRAGLLPQLALQPMEGMESPMVLVLRPRAAPLQQLAAVLASLPGAADSLECKLAKTEEGKYRAFHQMASSHRDRKRSRLVIVVDQFEELFTECEDSDAREAFIANLEFAASEPDQLVSIIFTLRSDFAGAVPLSSVFGRAARERALPVQAMSRAELAASIKQPAEELGCAWPQAFVERLVDQVEGRAGALPLLQFALQQLWPKLVSGRLDSLGSTRLIEDFLTDTADDLFAAADTQDQCTLRRAFLAMIQLGEGTADTRRVAHLSDFVARGDDPEHVRKVLEPYTDPAVRIVTASEQRSEPAYELTHEALITSWGRLRIWLGNVSDKSHGDRIRDDLRFHRRLTVAAAEWEGGRGDLSRPPELSILQDYRTRADADLTKREWAFAEASEAAWKQEKQRVRRDRNRMRIGLAIVSLLLVISITAGFIAAVFWQKTSSTLLSLRLESAQRLSIQSQQFLDAGNIDQSAASLLDAAKLLSESDGSVENFKSSLVRTISTIAQKPFPISARRQGIFLTLPFDDTLVISAAKKPGLIEIWRTPDPAQLHRVATIDLNSPKFYYAIDIGRRELYTFVVGDKSLKRWSLADGSELAAVESPILPKNYSGAVDFRPHLGGLFVFDGEVGAVFEPTLGTTTPASPEVIAEFKSERPTKGDIDHLSDLITAGPSQDVVGETQFSLREFGGPQHLAFTQSCRFAVSGGNDGVLKIWDAKSGSLAKSIEIGDRIAAVSISPTCDMVASFGLRSGIIVASLLDSSKRYRIYSKEGYDNFEFDESGSSLILLDESESSLVPVQLPASIARNANVLSDVIDFVPSKDNDHYLVRSIKPTRSFEPWVTQYYREDEPSGKLYFSARDAKTLQPRCIANVDYPDDAISALKADEQKTFTSKDTIDETERKRVNRVIDGNVVLIGGDPCSYFLVGIGHHVYALELVRDSEHGRWEWRKLASLHSGYKDGFPNFWTFHDISLGPEGLALYTDDGWRLFRRESATKSWTSVALEDLHFGVRPASPPNDDLDSDQNSGLPSLNYLGLLGSKGLIVLSTSMETLVVDDQGRTKARFRPASNCAQIVARTKLGDLLIQEYETGEDNACSPHSSFIDAEALSLRPITTGYLATPEQSGRVFLRVQDDRVALVDRLGHVQCELPSKSLPNVEIHYPTVSQMDARARMRVLAGGFYFGPAWHARRSKTKIAMMEEAGYFAAATNAAVIVYRSKDCAEVGRATVDSQLWSVVPFPNSKLFVIANGDRSYSIWDARAAREVFKGSGVAQIRNVIEVGSDVFSIEGIREDLNFVRVDRAAINLLQQVNATLLQKLRNWVEGR